MFHNQDKHNSKMNARCHTIAILLPLSLFSMAFGLEKIPALIGQPVLVPCVCPGTTVGIKWFGPYGDVACFYRDGQSDPDHQHPSYEGRADCGNGTLHLKNVSSSDFGLYRCQCTIKEDGEEKTKTVREIYLQEQGLKRIPAHIGQDVLVPCVCPNTTVGVKWFGPNGDVACFYRDGQSNPEAQGSSYAGRADCRNGTLHLKNVSSSDFRPYQYQCLKKGGEDGPPINISLYDRGTTAGDITLGNTTARNTTSGDATDDLTIVIIAVVLVVVVVVFVAVVVVVVVVVGVVVVGVVVVLYIWQNRAKSCSVSSQKDSSKHDAMLSASKVND